MRHPAQGLVLVQACATLTERAPLVVECPDDVRARTRRARRASQAQIEFLPEGMLQSAAMTPYLERWRRDEAAPGARASAPERRARCAYRAMD